MKGVYVFLVLMTAGQQALAEITPLQPLPPDLQKYLDICHETGDLSQNTGQLVFWASIQQYVSKFTQRENDLSPRQAELLSRTVYEIMEPIMSNQTGARYKRQAPDVRVRKEIRAMTLDERRAYFNALNRAKNDRRLAPNVYDVIARFHTGGNIARAHFGPAFPSWHRIYLYIFETVLRQWYDRTVTIPYWASVMDNAMVDSTQSVIWSDGFYGNGNGVVNRGPFSNWPTITPGNTIRRNIGNGNLMSYTGIANILRRVRNADILFPTALPGSNLELQHGGPHQYVGGTMNNLQRAAFDPIFFSHHAFIDEIWERFRGGQFNAGINPEDDYPYDPTNARFESAHAPWETAGFSAVGDTTLFGMRLATLTQRVGYRRDFSDIVRYEPVPRCPDCSFSPYLFCEANSCVSRTITEMAGTFYVQDLGLPSFTRPLPNVPVPNAGPMPPPPPPPVHQNEGCPKRTFIADINTNRLGQGSIHGHTTVNQWAYIPVKVVSKRPPNMKHYDDFNLYDDHMHSHVHNDLTSKCLQKGYDGCKADQDAVGKLKIVSVGLNYDGYAEDFIIVDNRLGVSEGNGFLPVKKPTSSSEIEVIVAAFDACGRVCKPYCNLPYCERLNKEFNGGLSITSRTPKQFYNTYEEAILSVWKKPSSFGPTYDKDVVPVTFFCEYGDTWIWDRYVPPPWTPPAVSITPSPSIIREPIRNSNIVTTLRSHVHGHHSNQSPDRPIHNVHNQRPAMRPVQSITTTQPTVTQPTTANRSDFCQVSTDCVVNVPCRGCTDFDHQICRHSRKMAICFYGQYSVSVALKSHRRHFYDKPRSYDKGRK